MFYNFFKGYVIIKFIVSVMILLFTTLQAYQPEDKLKVVLVGKVGKYVTWNNQDNKNFIITILNNRNGDLFDKIYKNKKINKRFIELKYIENIGELSTTNILFISLDNSKNLQEILKKTANKNILTVSVIRGFAQKGGMLQIYFLSQKPKIRINLDVSKKENLKIKSSLLRISDIVKDN